MYTHNCSYPKKLPESTGTLYKKKDFNLGDYIKTVNQISVIDCLSHLCASPVILTVI